MATWTSMSAEDTEAAARRALERSNRNGNGNGNGRVHPAATPAISVVIPTKNEAGNIDDLVARLELVLPEVSIELVFVDDSDDDTPAAVKRAARVSSREIRLVHREGEKRSGGLGGAVVEGMRVARAPWVCVMDADLQHPPEVLEEIVAKATGEHADLVVASRFVENGSVGQFGPVRRALSRTSSTLAGLIFRGPLRDVSDPMSGFFMVRRDRLDIDSLRPQGFKILLEVLVRTPRLRIAEVPFEFGERLAGESKASAREGLNYLAQLWRLRLSAIANRVGRFGLVGISGLVVNTLVLAALAELAGIWYLAAAVLATQASTLWNFAFTELWVFGERDHARSGARRMAMFFLVNNVALALRAPLLVGLTEGLGVHYVASNVLSLVVVFVARFAMADSWIWARADDSRAGLAPHNYDIHGLITVASEGRLPELERFRIREHLTNPTIHVRIGNVKRERAQANGNGNGNGAAPSGLDASIAAASGRIRYVEGRVGLGFGADIEMADGRISVMASPLLKRSPHVLYTNVVEPILRWTFAEKGYALVHAACMAHDGKAFLITARTDTGKTTTCLKTLDHRPYSFMSDDLCLLSPDGRVMTYPKPLTISRHTLFAVKTPLLSRLQRLTLFYQSRLHSRSGRRFAMIIAKTHLPAATINAIVQLLVPPPKYQVDKLIPHVEIAPEAKVAGLMIIQRGGVGNVMLEPDEALDILLTNCEDAYGFPPYAEIEHFLHSRNGSDLRAVERAIIASALEGAPATLLKSETMDWHLRVTDIVDTTLDEARKNGKPNGHGVLREAREAVARGVLGGPQVAAEPAD